MNRDIDFVGVDFQGRRLEIEYQWIGAVEKAAPLMIFLHEGLGSLAMWKDFPQRLCDELGFRGLVYSRPGYGRSTARASDESWDVDFMHRQAQLLPVLLHALGVDSAQQKPWLFGHSDGASIALLYAARYRPEVDGLVLMSPHIMVEDISVESIELARRNYLETDMQQKLARYHSDPDSAFWGWNDIWLLPAFRDWSIEDEIGVIDCALLAVQGVDDEYGTLEQVYGIARRVAQAEVVELDDCGHSPHRDQADKLIEVTREFVLATRKEVIGAKAGNFA